MSEHSRGSFVPGNEKMISKDANEKYHEGHIFASQLIYCQLIKHSTQHGSSEVCQIWDHTKPVADIFL